MRKLSRGLPWLAALLALGVMSHVARAKGGESDGQLPAPTGPYAIGRAYFNWTDYSRPDAKSPHGHREVVAWLWYPAAAPGKGTLPAQWMPAKWGELYLTQLAKADAATAQRLQAIRSHAYTNAALAAGGKKFPVLVFAPGMGSWPLEYTSLIEDLVSRGYVVAGIVPSGFVRSVLADGSVLDGAAPAVPPMPGQADTVAPLWSGDMRFALDQLTKLNSDAKSRYKGRLDLTRVGAFGHSQGGASSLLWAREDERVRAVADIDGMLSPKMSEGPLTKPALVLSSGMAIGFGPPGGMPKNPLFDYASVLKNAKPGYHLTLKGSMHLFSLDVGALHLELKPPAAPPPPTGPGPGPGGPMMMSPPAGAGPPPGTGGPSFSMGPMQATSTSDGGSIDPLRALSVTRAYVAAFFDQYLQGKASALLTGPSADYPEISFGP